MARSDFRRRPATRGVGQQVIIACEGQSEQAYFNAIRIERRLPALRVLLVHEGTDPRNVVRAAIAKRREKRVDHAWDEAIDSAWAVYDGDEHLRNDPSNWHEALDLAGSNKIRLAISNPCIEFWYLLHFEDRRAHLSREQAMRLLEGHCPGYRKGVAIFLDALQSRTQTAIERARALTIRAEADDLTPYENPCTGVADLVELLLRLA